MYAIVETGGKQYKVAIGDTVDVERLDAAVGDEVALERVLLVADDGGVRVGQPAIDGATVSATVVQQAKAPKVIVFKYRAKQRYRVKKGHRQEFTRLRIDGIQA
ncbi:MAG: 50S ribosomal protein L21 [Chloroflexi bacterium]|jgi:large subunit ribosomal protein L21|nr:50S ribosomal protein L21 [Chloroflexota bacterium]